MHRIMKSKIKYKHKIPYSNKLNYFIYSFYFSIFMLIHVFSYLADIFL